jgi:hypothetical protein
MEPSGRLANILAARRTSRRQECAVHTDLLESGVRWRAVLRFPYKEVYVSPTVPRRSSVKWKDARNRLSSLVCARSIATRTMEPCPVVSSTAPARRPLHWTWAPRSRRPSPSQCPPCQPIPGVCRSFRKRTSKHSSSRSLWTPRSSKLSHVNFSCL